MQRVSEWFFCYWLSRVVVEKGLLNGLLLLSFGLLVHAFCLCFRFSLSSLTLTEWLGRTSLK